MGRTHLIAAGAALGALAIAGSAQAALTLTLVNSYARSGAFGLAYDGANMWWSDSGGTIHEMTTGGVDTGNSMFGTTWSALAWDPNTNKIAIVENNGITEYDRPTSGSVAASTLNPVHTNIAGNPNFLTDGLDIEGSTLWWSPDVSFVAHSNLDGSGSSTTFLPAAGGYSGVEFVAVGSNDYIFVVNDETQPRELCYHDLSAAELGCTTLPNSRYEDLAFDGRYLWAADFYGNRIDKIDLIGDNGSIFEPGVPEPSTWVLAILGLGGVGATLRRRRLRPA